MEFSYLSCDGQSWLLSLQNSVAVICSWPSHTELKAFLRRDAKWALAIICRPGKLKIIFLLGANNGQIQSFLAYRSVVLRYRWERKKISWVVSSTQWYYHIFWFGDQKEQGPGEWAIFWVWKNFFDMAIFLLEMGQNQWSLYLPMKRNTG